MALGVISALGLLAGVVIFGFRKNKGKAWIAQAGALAILICTMIFACGACGSRTLMYYVGDDDEIEAGIGVFATYLEYPEGGLTRISESGGTCDSDAWWSQAESEYGPEDGDCRTALAHRCYAGQTWAMFGVLANIAAVALLGLTVTGKLLIKLPTAALPALVFFASFSYMLVFAVWAPIYTSDKACDPRDNGCSGDTSSCGMGASENKDIALGPAFAFFVINFLFTAIAGGLLMIFKTSESVTFSTLTNSKQPTFDNTAAKTIVS